MVQPKTYHQDRPATPAERMRALRVRNAAKRNALEPSVTAKRNATGIGIARRAFAHVAKLGLPLDDRKAQIKVISEIYGEAGKEAALEAYDRAMPDRPHLNRWFSLAQQWGGQQFDTYDLVLDLIDLAGPSRFDRLGSWFDSIEQQWGGEDKYTQLVKLHDELGDDPQNFPKRRPQRGKSIAIVKGILVLMRRNPKRFWVTSELADKLHIRQSYVASYAANAQTQAHRIGRRGSPSLGTTKGRHSNKKNG
jgi:hypothetical protein